MSNSSEILDTSVIKDYFDLSEDHRAKRIQKEELTQLLNESTLPKVKEEMRRMIQELDNLIIIP